VRKHSQGLYAAARLYINFFQPSFKLKEKRREGAKVIKRYHVPSTPCKRALVHPKLAAAVKKPVLCGARGDRNVHMTRRHYGLRSTKQPSTDTRGPSRGTSALRVGESSESFAVES
jgi:hypothetical protein